MREVVLGACGCKKIKVELQCSESKLEERRDLFDVIFIESSGISWIRWIGANLNALHHLVQQRLGFLRRDFTKCRNPVLRE
ncbi:GTP-binding protein [Cernens ardua]|uniref:GTP-binding protein n=1 Tax=Cernens ardua TaxID=3402176 RepID=UPI003F99DFCA